MYKLYNLYFNVDDKDKHSNINIHKYGYRKINFMAFIMLRFKKIYILVKVLKNDSFVFMEYCHWRLFLLMIFLLC